MASDSSESPRGMASSVASPRWRLAIAGIACSALAFLVYADTLDGEFCFDDKPAIQRNLDIRSSSPWSDLLRNDFWGVPMHSPTSHKSYRPLTVATFRLNFLLHQLQPMGYHLVNVLLHSAVCFLYVLLCASVFDRVGPALIAGLLFAVHPIHTEAVAGVVGRADVLAALFFVTALLCYRMAVLSQSTKNYAVLLAVTLLLSLCSALCKETGITVTGLCILYEFFSIHQMDGQSSLALLRGLIRSGSDQPPRQLRGFVIRCVVLALFALIFLTVRITLNQGPPTFSVNNNPAMAFATPYRQLHWAYLCFFNLWLLLNPWHLCAEYALGTIPAISSIYDPRNLLTAITFLTLLLLTLYVTCGSSRHKRIAMFGLCLLVVPFIPASNLFFPVGFVIAERVLYIPSMGFTFLVGYGFWQMLVRTRTRRTVAGLNGAVKLVLICLLVVHSTKTVVRNRDWYSDSDLYSSALRISNSNAKMHNYLGHVLYRNGSAEIAELLFRKAIVCEPNYVTPYMNLGSMMRQLNRTEDALQMYREAEILVTENLAEDTHVTPKSVKVYNSLAELLVEAAGSLEEAYHFSTKAVKWEPDWEIAHNTMGSILLGMGRFSEARREFETAISLKSDYALAHSNLGRALGELDEVERAKQHYRNALSLNSNDTVTKFRLAALVAKTHSTQEKLHEAERLMLDVLDLEPENGNATLTLALIYYDLKEFYKAEIFFRKALTITPHDTSALHDFSVMLTHLGRYSESIELLETLLRISPRDRDAQAQVGTCYMQMGQSLRAVEVYEKVLLLDPAHSTALNNLGLLMIQLKRYSRAIDLFSKVVELEPYNEPARSQLQELRKFVAKQTRK